jgi:uncharacterized protein YjiS (DUF1127 family)
MSAFQSFLALPDLAARSMSFGATEAYIRIAREERARAMADILARMVGAFRRWNARRRTEAALRNLDDRVLNDIGLSRAEINQIASGHYLADEPATSAPIAPAAPANAERRDTRAA